MAWLIDCKTTILITAEKSLKQKSFSKKTTWLIARQPYQLRLKNLLSRKVFKENNLIDCKITISIMAEKSLKQKKFSKKTTRLIENQEEMIMRRKQLWL